MKKFIIKISYTILPIWLFFVIITIHYSVNIKPEISGDLGVLSQRAFGMEYSNRLKDTNSNEILYKTIATIGETDTSSCDVLTTGDSFSDMGLYGYQNYMCRSADLKLYNIASFDPNSFAFAYYLLDNGLIDSSKVKHLIVEIVERNFLNRMLSFESDYSNLSNTTPTNTTPTNTEKNSLNDHKKEDRRHIKIHTGDVPENGVSLLKAKNWFMLRLGFHESVYDCKLNSSLFAHDKYDKSLFFYRDDINDLHINKENGEVVKSTLDKLFDKAKAQGVNLIILIAADKYDVYQPFIVNNRYEPKTINEDLAKLYPSPNIIISKFILQSSIFDGEKDIYLVNDSHWSYKASQLVAQELLKRIEGTK